MCDSNDKEMISDFLFPLLVAVTTYVLFNKLDEWKMRKDQSILGTVIIDSMIEEVKNGYEAINSTLTSEDYFHPMIPPRKSWTGMNTIPDDVLLRIIAVSKDVRAKSFNPREIRIHCKNYFDHMLTNWDQLKDTKVLTPQATAKLNFGSYNQAAKAVLTMLEQTRKLLDDNSKKWIPD